MLTLEGKLLNVFKTDTRTDRKSGEVFQAKEQLQLEVFREYENGSRRVEVVTLSYPGALALQKRVGEVLRVPVGVFAASQVTYYALKGIEL